ncbi:ACT domain-containing protein (plasmid) [Pantoea sp. JZ29]|uniref:ACT domain-containing protein n=1 Tax=Pantoea sp. JZ29 TaxID=2654192 RepID=UPI003088C093|nr:ACT domain-containing protein [Pantoea sp. JZ29]
MSVNHYSTLKLQVENHPGTMSHICGLFSRRAFNVEGILCIPSERDGTSIILIQVTQSVSLEQVIRQLRKLEDVISVEISEKMNGFFINLSRSILSDIR